MSSNAVVNFLDHIISSKESRCHGSPNTQYNMHICTDDCLFFNNLNVKLLYNIILFYIGPFSVTQHNQ